MSREKKKREDLGFEQIKESVRSWISRERDRRREKERDGSVTRICFYVLIQVCLLPRFSLLALSHAHVNLKRQFFRIGLRR